MANIAKHQLDRKHQKLIADALADRPGRTGQLAKAYDINARRFSDWATGTPMSRRVHGNFSKLIVDLETDPTKAFREAGIVEMGYSAEVNQIVKFGRELTGGNRFSQALTFLVEGFARVPSPESAMYLLPEIIYTGYRFCETEPFCRQLSWQILPRLQSAKRQRLGDEVTRWTCASQLTCALNEGGQRQLSSTLFESSWSQNLLGHRQAPTWLRPQFLRNQAHNLAWYGSSTQSLDQARGMVLEALRSHPSAQNNFASAHSLCDLYLARRQYARAWEAIAELYLPVRAKLLRGGEWPKGEPTTLMLAFSMYVSGTLSRTVVDGDGYTQKEQERDLRALEYWLAQLGGRAECGHPTELPTEHPKIPQRLREITLRCHKRIMTPEQSMVLQELASYMVA